MRKFHWFNLKNYHFQDPRMCQNRNKGRKHPDVDSKVEKMIRRFYAEENRLFYKLINKTFDWPS